MTPEGKVKKQIRKILDSYGGIGVYYFMPVQSGYGRKGPGDFICSVWGLFVAIEAKSGDGQQTELQKIDSQKVKKSRGIKIVIRESNLHKLEPLINLLKLLREK